MMDEQSEAKLRAWIAAGMPKRPSRSPSAQSRVSNPGRRRRLRRRVLARDGGVCVYCGAEATTIDHVVPLSKGGADSDENAVASCQPCNSAKADNG